MSALDDDVKRFAMVVFENVRQRYGLDHRRIIPCLAIALGAAEGDLLFTNPEITVEEAVGARERTLVETRDVAIQALRDQRDKCA